MSQYLEDDGISQLRAQLQNDASKILKGVTNNDVDWLLRGRNIDSSQVKNSAPALKSFAPKLTATVASDTTTIAPRHSQDYSLHRSKTLDDTPSHERSDNALRRTSTITPASTRTRSHSISSLKKASEPKKGGFFRKIFSSDSKKEEPLNPPAPTTQTRPLLSSARNSTSNVGPSSPKISPRDSVSSELPAKAAALAPHPLLSQSVDPRLEEYMASYRKRVAGAELAQGGAARLYKPVPQAREPRLDGFGHPIPPHPDVSPLPPAITNAVPAAEFQNLSANDSNLRQQNTGGKFNILRRHSNFNGKSPQTAPVPVPVGPMSSSPRSSPRIYHSSPHDSTTLLAEEEDDYATHISASNIANKEARVPQLAYLQKIEPLRKVAFAADVFVHDPPQQIPSRHPRLGNVEVQPDGTIKIRPLTEEEKRQIARSGGGVIVGGSGHLRLLTEEEKRQVEAAEADHDDGPKDAHSASVAPGTEHELASKVQIDKPMVSRHKQFDENGHYIMEQPAVKLQLDELYTRCCHLREILPIPAIVKQIPKGTTAPLLVLQLRNPRPSMIEVLSFSDFIRIAPIICISLDGVHLSDHMFRIILSALVYKRHLEKLSLRNTPISDAGWRLLCWFLSVNKRLRRLDLTQCPSLSINTQKLKSDQKTESTKQDRMLCHMDNRSDMDWSLFNATLILRGGIEEIILSGCKIPNLQVFQDFMKLVVLLRTVKLGLLYNDLGPDELKIVAEVILGNENLLGLDLGYNDLSKSIEHFTNFTERHYEMSSVKFLSLNATNLRPVENTKKLIILMSRLRNLKFLDLSNNPLLFPLINDDLFTYLPLFPDLVRIHLESNNLDTKSIVTIAEMLTLCPHLYYISLVGNKLDLAGCLALVNGLKASKSLLTLDIDYKEVPAELREKIGLYTMRNMERVLYSKKEMVNKSTGEREQSPLAKLDDSASRLLHDRMIDLLHKNNNSVTKDMVQSFVKEAHNAKMQITELINELFLLQQAGKLNMEGKESLIRFCFLDSSLEKLLALIDSKYQVLVNDVRDYTTHPMSLGELSNPVVDPGDDQMPDELKNDNVSEEVSITKAPSSKSLKDLDKAEGSVMKLTGFLTPKDIDEIGHVDEEQIKEVLLNPVNLQMVTEVLTQVKKQGLPLEELFKKNPNLRPRHNHSGGLNVETLKQELKNMKLDSGSNSEASMSSKSITEHNTKLNKNSTFSPNGGPEDSDLSDISNSDYSDDEEEQEEEETHAINETYDSLLSDLVKVKTNTN